MSNTLKLGNGKWATGKDTLLSFSDTNNNYKPLPFSFSRDSSGTVINKDGLIETVGTGEPRIDFKDNTKGALLLEPSRSNVIQYSEDFSQWGVAGTPLVVSSNELAPNGYYDAYDITDDNSGIYEIIRSNSASFDGTYTLSFFIKKTIGLLSHYAGAQFLGLSDYLIIDTTNGIVNQTASEYSNIKTEDFGNWWKISATGTNTGSGFLVNIWAAISSNGTSLSSFAVGTNTFFGAQLEQGSYATSYIPTSGQANGVTRVAESSSQTPPDGVIGQTEGVIYWEGIINGFDINFSNIVTGEKNTTTSFAVLHKGSSSQFQCSVFDGSEKGKCIGGSVSVGETCKIAYAYKSGNFALYVNGVSVAISTDTWTPSSTIDDIYIGDTTSYFGNKESNTHKEVKLYNTRLSNSELVALTTI